MKTSLLKAIELILAHDFTLMDIIDVTLRMSLSSSLIALLLGVPIGVWLAMGRSHAKQVLIVFNRTMMGLPPVVCGLLCYMMFSGVGPLGFLRLLYTVKGMVIAQVILITPIVAGTLEAYANGIAPVITETARGLRLSRGRTYLLTMGECRYQICSTWLLAFARAIAEVGAVSMVGGAISYKTNVMTTAIQNSTSRGDFTTGVAMGLVLLLLSLVLNLIVYFAQRRWSR